MTPFMAYSDSIYWVLSTMTSTGYGDISANTNNKLEMIVASMVMIFGKMVLGLMLGNIASTQANMGMLRSVFAFAIFLLFLRRYSPVPNCKGRYLIGKKIVGLKNSRPNF